MCFRCFAYARGISKLVVLREFKVKRSRIAVEDYVVECVEKGGRRVYLSSNSCCRRVTLRISLTVFVFMNYLCDEVSPQIFIA